MPDERLSTLISFHHCDVSDADRARWLADDLAARGHRLVRQRRRRGRVEVLSLVDEPAASRREEYEQHEAEGAAVAALARRYGGYLRSQTWWFRDAAGSTGPDPGDEVLRTLTAAEAHAVRRTVIAGFPGPAPEPRPPSPLGPAPEAEHPPLLAVLRTVAPAGSRWHSAEAEAEGYGDTALAVELHDGFMHQGTLYEHTVEDVPLLAALASRDEVRPEIRAMLIAFLHSAATAGRRFLAHGVDGRVSLGMVLEENGLERRVREAVETVVPKLLARWDGECEAVRFTLGLLAAAGPGSGRGGRLRAWAESETGPRGRMLRLMAALADGGDEDCDEAAVLVDGMAGGGFVSTEPSPIAPLEARAHQILEEWAGRELGLLPGP